MMDADLTELRPVNHSEGSAYQWLDTLYPV